MRFTTLALVLAGITPAIGGPAVSVACHVACATALTACIASGFYFPPMIAQCQAAYGVCQLACTSSAFLPTP
ncbi:hypothetical protein F5883DRAFT_564952 [Diaporthe sp. PMI_573]|nr:hypothetical protein F5883DRAFT_564952 [Diaporthaceae sp. PMI_573]